MTKAPKKDDTRAKALAAMTKPELLKTIKALDKRQTALLNEISSLKTAQNLTGALLNSAAAGNSVDALERSDEAYALQRTRELDAKTEHITPTPPVASFPWNN